MPRTKSLSKTLKSQQVAAKAKLLKQREADLAEREKLLDDSPLIATIERLDKQIAIKEDMLSNLHKAVAEKERQLHDVTNSYQNQAEAINLSLEKRKAEYNQLIALQEQKALEITNAEEQLQGVQREIAERQSYMKEQEAVVNSTMAEWNGRLTLLQTEADTLQNQKRTVLEEITQLEQLKQPKQAEVEQIEQKIESLRQIYQTKLTEFQGNLQKAQATVAARENQAFELDKTMQARLQVVTSREQALDIRESAVHQKELELVNKERNIDTKAGMLQLN